MWGCSRLRPRGQGSCRVKFLRVYLDGVCIRCGLINELFELVTANRVKADLAVLCDAAGLSQRLILVPSRGGNAKDMLVLIQSKKAPSMVLSLSPSTLIESRMG